MFTYLLDHPECMCEGMPCVIAVGLHARMCEWGVPVWVRSARVSEECPSLELGRRFHDFSKSFVVSK